MELPEFLESMKAQEARGAQHHAEAYYSAVKDRVKFIATREKTLAKKKDKVAKPVAADTRPLAAQDDDTFTFPAALDAALAPDDAEPDDAEPQGWGASEAAGDWPEAAGAAPTPPERAAAQKTEVGLLQRGLGMLGLGSREADEAALDARRKRLRFLLARSGPQAHYKETLKTLKGFRVEKMDASELSLAEEAIALSGYSSWCSAAAEKTALMMAYGAIHAGEVYQRPPRKPQAVIDTVMADRMLLDDIGSAYSALVVDIPLPVRIALNFAADVAVGYAQGGGAALPPRDEGGPVTLTPEE